MRRVARVALIAGFLSPVTGAGLLLSFAYIRFGAAVPQDVYMTYFRHLVVSLIIFGALPAAVFTGMGLGTFVKLRARGLSPRALLLLGSALGAGCCLLVAGVFLGTRTPKLWALAAVLNGAMWGLVVAYYALKAPRRVPTRPAR